MKKLTEIGKGILFLGIWMIAGFTLYAQNDSVNVYAFTSEPSIDGIIDDGWAVNEYMEISHLLSHDPVSPDNFSGKFKIGWYQNTLYFLFVVTDDILVLNVGKLFWLGDNINLYLDLGNEKNDYYDNNDYLVHFKWGNSDYYELHTCITCLEQIDNSDTGIEFAQICDTVSHTFVMEIAVRNIAELNGPSVLSDTTSIGLDAAIFDSDDSLDIYSNVLSWVDTIGSAWYDPTTFGTAGLATIRLKSAKSQTGIGSFAAGQLLHVFPTVVSDRMHIQTTADGDLIIEITDLLGVTRISAVAGPENACLDISPLKHGLYFVNVTDTKGQLIGSQKIIKL